MVTNDSYIPDKLDNPGNNGNFGNHDKLDNHGNNGNFGNHDKLDNPGNPNNIYNQVVSVNTVISEALQTETVENEIPKFQWTAAAYVHQVKLTILVSLGFLAIGTIISFPSVLISDLDRHPHNIYGTELKLSDTHKDLLGSTCSLGSILGLVVSAGIATRYGRKMALGGLALITVLQWLGVAVSPNASCIQIFRTISGAAYGGYSVIVMAYVVELTDDRLRGAMTLLLSVALTFGQVIGMLPIFWLRYYNVCFINCVFPGLLFFLTIFVMPESPRHLVIKGRDEKASKILEKLRTPETNIEKEIQSYKDLNNVENNDNIFKSLCEKTILTRIGIVCVLFAITSASGYITFVAQTARIIEHSGIPMDSRIGTMAVQAVQIIGVFISISLVRRLGRKGSLLLSHLIMALAVAGLATYTLLVTGHQGLVAPNITTTESSSWTIFINYNLTELTSVNSNIDDITESKHLNINNTFVKQSTENDYDNNTSDKQSTENDYDNNTSDNQFGWVALLCLMLAQMGSCFGTQNVPFILASEYFPTSIRPQAATVCIAFGRVVAMVSLQMYSPLHNMLGQANLLYLHSLASVLAIPFTYFVVQETVGHSVG